MSGCTCGTTPPIDAGFTGKDRGYRRVLWVIIALNAIMFVVELASGHFARSMALQADSLDFAGDAATYGLTLYAIGRGPRFRAGAALIKGVSMLLIGLIILLATAWRVLLVSQPEPTTMSLVGALALAVNLAAVGLLIRWRAGDANVRSVWLCSRNDAIGNLGVILAAGLVAVTASPWPDLIIAALIAALFLRSAIAVIRQARREQRALADRPASGSGAATAAA
jgi:Co/Zn/Cd efflux system component